MYYVRYGASKASDCMFLNPLLSYSSGCTFIYLLLWKKLKSVPKAFLLLVFSPKSSNKMLKTFYERATRVFCAATNNLETNGSLYGIFFRKLFVLFLLVSFQIVLFFGRMHSRNLYFVSEAPKFENIYFSSFFYHTS